jgi:hypothetical protein
MYEFLLSFTQHTLQFLNILAAELQSILASHLIHGDICNPPTMQIKKLRTWTREKGKYRSHGTFILTCLVKALGLGHNHPLLLLSDFHVDPYTEQRVLITMTIHSEVLS